jgi:MGT family glycosyltransferase
MLISPTFDFAAATTLPANVRYTGAIPDARSGAWENPWPDEDARPLIVVSFSTNFADQRPLAARVMRALADQPVRVFVTTGPALNLDGITIPSNVVVRQFVPHASIFPSASLVVTHGGLGTVMTALAAGVPLVCLPDGRDRFDNAARVVVLGAGVRASPRASARSLRRIIGAAVRDVNLKRGAEETAAKLEREDGLGEAIAALEALAARHARSAAA